MTKNSIIIFTIGLLTSCGQSDKNNQQTKDDLTKQETSTIEISSDSLRKEFSNQPNTESTDTQKGLLGYEFKRAELIGLKDSIREDLNGDGFLDKAIFTNEDGKSGILIMDGQTNEEIKIGLGNEFEEMGDDFSWVDYWGIVRDSITYEIIIENAEILGDTIVQLDNPSIVVRKEEVGGGLITFRNGKYEWIHQAD